MNPRFDVKIPEELKREIVDFSLNDDNKYFDTNKTDRLYKRRKFCIISNYPELLLTTNVKEFADYAYSKIGVPRVVLSLGAYVHPGAIKYITDLMG